MTIVLLKFLSKNIQIRFFGPNFRHFCFPAKFCNYTNSRVLISNTTILFSNSSPKIPKSGIFGPKFTKFCFSATFCNQANSRVLISNVTILFLNSTSKRHNSGIFVPQFGYFYFFGKILQIDKFEGADFKYDNRFFKILAQKYPIKAFWVKNTQIRHFWSQI